jgi:hypothetical protein
VTTVLDDALLDDTARLLETDRGGVLRAAATAGAQVRATWDAADDAGIARLAGLRPRALVLLIRPGPAETAARVVAALLAPTCPAPVVVTSTAPPWLGPLDVVLASHEGRDGDPADAVVAEGVDRAVRRGATVVLTGPSDGPVAAAAAGRAITVVPRLPVPGGLDTPTDLAAAFAATGALGLIDVDREALADRLDDEAERDGPRGEAFVNPAKTLALRLAEHTPLLWGTDPVAGALAAHAVDVLAAQAGVVAHATTLAGAAHLPALATRLAAGASVDAVFADPFDDPSPDGPAPRLVLVSVAEDLGTRRLTADARSRWPVADVFEIDDVDLAGEGPSRDALRVAVLAARMDFTALYLGLATGAVPEAGRA